MQRLIIISPALKNHRRQNGRLAQLVEHSLDVRRVSGSSPLTSTTMEKSELNANRQWVRIFCFIFMINNIISCEFNIDTSCVEVKLADGSMVSIDCDAVENEYSNNMYETSELDYLIYNEPTSYVRLLLSGKMEEYLRNNTDYTSLSDMR